MNHIDRLTQKIARAGERAEAEAKAAAGNVIDNDSFRRDNWLPDGAVKPSATGGGQASKPSQQSCCRRPLASCAALARIKA